MLPDFSQLMIGAPDVAVFERLIEAFKPADPYAHAEDTAEFRDIREAWATTIVAYLKDEDFQLPENGIDYILTLGACPYITPLTFEKRVDKAVELAGIYRNSRVFFSGGNTPKQERRPDQNKPEAEAMALKAISDGIPQYRILTEPLSTHLKANLENSYPLIDKDHLSGTHPIRVAVVSSSSCLRRAQLNTEWLFNNSLNQLAGKFQVSYVPSHTDDMERKMYYEAWRLLKYRLEGNL